MRMCSNTNAVVAVYDIPPDAARQHINSYFPHLISERRESAKWILARPDDIFFAVGISVSGTWHQERGYDHLTLRHPRTAVVLEAVAARSESSLEAFCARMTKNRPAFDEPTLTTVYITTGGHQIRFTHRGARVVDGISTNLSEWPMFKGPWMNSELGTGVITLRSDRERVTLDFNTTTVRTETVKGD